MFDYLSYISLAFLIMVIGTYFGVFFAQYHSLSGNAADRLAVLITRTALTFSLFALLTYIGIVAPAAYVAMEIAAAAVLGGAFHLYLCLVVTNMGGAQQTVQALRGANRPLRCFFCFPAEMGQFYRQVVRAVWHLSVTRVVVLTAAAVLYYVDRDVTTLLYLVLQIVAAVQLVHGVVSVGNLCEWLCHGLHVYCIDRL